MQNVVEDEDKVKKPYGYFNYMNKFEDSLWPKALHLNEQRVLELLARKAKWPEGELYHSIKTLSSYIGKSPRQFINYLNFLTKIGLIKRWNVKTQTNYRYGLKLANPLPKPDVAKIKKERSKRARNPEHAKSHTKSKSTKKSEDVVHRGSEDVVHRGSEDVVHRGSEDVVHTNYSLTNILTNNINYCMQSSPQRVEDQLKIKFSFCSCLRKIFKEKTKTELTERVALQLLDKHPLDFLLEKLNNPRLTQAKNPIGFLIEAAAKDYELDTQKMYQKAYECRQKIGHPCEASYTDNEDPPHPFCHYCEWYYCNLAPEEEEEIETAKKLHRELDSAWKAKI